MFLKYSIRLCLPVCLSVFVLADSEDKSCGTRAVILGPIDQGHMGECGLYFPSACLSCCFYSLLYYHACWPNAAWNLLNLHDVYV